MRLLRAKSAFDRRHRYPREYLRQPHSESHASCSTPLSGMDRTTTINTIAAVRLVPAFTSAGAERARRGGFDPSLVSKR